MLMLTTAGLIYTPTLNVAPGLPLTETGLRNVPTPNTEIIDSLSVSCSFYIRTSAASPGEDAASQRAARAQANACNL